MDNTDFLCAEARCSDLARLLYTQYAVQAYKIRRSAHQTHANVNQTYGGNLPYGVHLDMVADAVLCYADYLPVKDMDALPVYFGAYFHDSMEDARLTYHDVLREAQDLMEDGQAHLAAEIVYALTNEKGRNRMERADDRYYAGIRHTPYAPFVKLADRLANMRFSFSHREHGNLHMRQVYRDELPHFLRQLQTDSSDFRLALPPDMVTALCYLPENSPTM